jgi:hypothetical protein
VRNTFGTTQILNHPEIPLHNNESEIATREPVIKRKISYGTRSELGKCAWENGASFNICTIIIQILLPCRG